jgi:pSer/pThr/pTyr-binding forkhead associated (FHA) protein
LIGRQDGCDVKLDVKSISKIHCLIAFGDDMLIVRDLKSTNGVRVNGRKADFSPVMVGDDLFIGGVRFRVAIGTEEEIERQARENVRRRPPPIPPGAVSQPLPTGAANPVRPPLPPLPPRPMAAPGPPPIQVVPAASAVGPPRLAVPPPAKGPPPLPVKFQKPTSSSAAGDDDEPLPLPFKFD